MNQLPVRIHPVYVRKPWAGGHFPGHETAGEWVLASGIEAFPTLTDTGISLREYWQTTGRDSAREAGLDFPEFPLLLKILSLRAPLSVQVHPSDDDVNPPERGKHEAWMVLQADADARIYAGLKCDISIAQFMNAQDKISLMREYNPVPGMTLDITPGTVHASQGRFMVLEIQQPSDITYRIDDFGRGRELHPDRAARVIRTAVPHTATEYTTVSTPSFRLESIPAARLVQKPWRLTSALGLISYLGSDIRAELTPASGGTLSVSFSRGDTLLVWKGTTLEVSGDTNANDARFFFSSV